MTVYRGLLAQVHRDLQNLHNRLDSARQEWRSDSDGRGAPPPLERMVLYIDDLDRCPPKRVVEVLGAVHLLLALPLFVVVVAVDSRWLVSSLRRHFEDLFGAGDEDSRTEMALDYLDKIFQVPYAVPSMSDAAGAAYLQALLPAETIEVDRNRETVEVDQNHRTTAADLDDQAETSPPPDGQLDAQGSTGEPSTFHGLDSRLLMGHRGAAHVLPDLTPEALRLRAPERVFIPVLGPLLSTPRGAKKLMNLYRLVRIGLADDQLDGFVGDDRGGPYQAVLILLAVLVSQPATARQLLLEVTTSTHASFFDLVGELSQRQPVDQRWQRLADALDRVRKQADQDKVVADLNVYRQWAFSVARFSFHTQDLLHDLDLHGLD